MYIILFLQIQSHLMLTVIFLLLLFKGHNRNLVLIFVPGDNWSTHGGLTQLVNQLQQCFWHCTNTQIVSALMWLLNGGKRWVLKWCAYKTLLTNLVTNAIVAEMWDGQESCCAPVVFGLQGVSEQDLFYEELFECMNEWIRQPTIE